jgi:spermidine/putrescine transport system substrate-binding protein
MMDFVSRPEIAAPLADYIWYVSPVPAAKDIVLNKLDDPLVANSPLVFPSPADLAKSQRYRVFKDQAEKEEWDSIFQPIYSS